MTCCGTSLDDTFRVTTEVDVIDRHVDNVNVGSHSTEHVQCSY